MNEPTWLAIARRQIGVREIKGPRHEPRILAWWRAIKRGGIRDDETPWCAAFVGACLEEAGVRSSRFESARSYLDWGVPLAIPVVGCVVVLGRAGGGGHVGLLDGITVDGDMAILGGNQGDAVSIAVFKPERLLGYRWPAGVPVPSPFQPLPLAFAAASQSEA